MNNDDEVAQLIDFLKEGQKYYEKLYNKMARKMPHL